MATISVVDVLIPAGQSMTDIVDQSKLGRVTHIAMPIEWGPAANLSFQISLQDDGTGDWYNLFDHLGNEVLMGVKPGQISFVPQEWNMAYRYIRIRSGRSTNPWIQETDSWLRVVILS